MASAVLPSTAGAVLVRPCVCRLRCRQLSSRTASCSYTTPVQHLRSRRSEHTRRAAQSDAVDTEAEEDFEEEQEDEEEAAPLGLSQDLLKLIAPRTTPTPLLSPAQVS